MIAETCKTMDIVITTALIPGKKAPTLVSLIKGVCNDDDTFQITRYSVNMARAKNLFSWLVLLPGPANEKCWNESK